MNKENLNDDFDEINYQIPINSYRQKLERIINKSYINYNITKLKLAFSEIYLIELYNNKKILELCNKKNILSALNYVTLSLLKKEGFREIKDIKIDENCLENLFNHPNKYINITFKVRKIHKQKIDCIFIKEKLNYILMKDTYSDAWPSTKKALMDIKFIEKYKNENCCTENIIDMNNLKKKIINIILNYISYNKFWIYEIDNLFEQIKTGIITYKYYNLQ